ncbi:MAG: hypothetical protein SA339_05830 [Methanomassiliicoccus sp.]|nr:hypothetical protein [Methanomassiliicoccus sp.]
MAAECYRCQEILAWLEKRERGRHIRCPICGLSYVKGRHWVLDEEGNLMNEDWQMSDQVAHCPSCGWEGMMKQAIFVEGNCFPFRCPSCGSIVAHRKAEEQLSLQSL